MDFSTKLYNSLIAENRYRLFLDGIGITLAVSFFAIIIGTVIGIAVAIINVFLPPLCQNLQRRNQSRTGNKKVLNELFVILPLKAVCLGANAYIDIIRGTPSYVQILIFNFVIFAKFSGVAFQAGCIAFGVNSGAYVAEIIRAGILSIDKGQTEAGRSLGFTAKDTLLLIVLPQAIKNILPALANEFIVLIKETAIIGYIGVQDLAKAGTIVMSRTFDPVVPLLSVAVLYFIIIKTLSVLFSMVEKRLRKSDVR